MCFQSAVINSCQSLDSPHGVPGFDFQRFNCMCLCVHVNMLRIVALRHLPNSKREAKYALTNTDEIRASALSWIKDELIK